METQCFFLPLEFISPDIFLGIALSTVMFICEKHFKTALRIMMVWSEVEGWGLWIHNLILRQIW